MTAHYQRQVAGRVIAIKAWSDGHRRVWLDSGDVLMLPADSAWLKVERGDRAVARVLTSGMLLSLDVNP